MKLHFDSNQQYQLDAIRAVTDLFEGQPLPPGDFETSFSYGDLAFTESGFGNQLLISEEQIRKNTQSVQKQNEITNASPDFQGMHFSIEMETGTGKTYVYLRTIYELNKLYGFKKFVIVVPSIAIREGVRKNLEITSDHFRTLYDNIPMQFNVYESKALQTLHDFSSSNTIQILILNIDAFSKDVNIINKMNETGKRPVEFILDCRPIIIIDEPQNITDNREKAIENLNPLCTLRYSATHTKVYNLIYSLNPVKAYNLKLVKQIEVDSVVSEHSMNNAFLRLENISANKKGAVAKLTIDCNTDKSVTRKTMQVTTGDDLYNKSNSREIYRNGFIIDGIDKANEIITFTNGVMLSLGETQGGMSEKVIKYMIQKTVEEHLQKEKAFLNKGIKVLSLFFIDKVKNYREYDASGNIIKGKFAQWFEEIYNKEISKPKFAELAQHTVDSVHDGYFSLDTKRQVKDTNGDTVADDYIFTLIMKKKEILLDLQTPLRFIFSHSALREGWDNPNVFQICTLNETRSELKKRQEIGRGLRLPVDQNGRRIFDEKINRLTIIANESYDDFAKALQEEIQEDCGVLFNSIQNKNNRRKVTFRKGFEVDPKFIEIWNKIKFKKRYNVNYNSDVLIIRTAAALKDRERMPETKRPQIRSTKNQIIMNEKGLEKRFLDQTMDKPGLNDFEIPDILSYIQNKTKLTRSTLFEILNQSGRLNEVLINPQFFLDNAIRVIQQELNALMIDGIRYEKMENAVYEISLFDDSDFEIYFNKDVDFTVADTEKTIYENLMPLDSKVENKFAKDCESNVQVEFYFKLPAEFKINTPIGTYNPDWAVVKEDKEKLFFIVETKGDNQELRGSEQMKIKCGKAFFAGLENGISYIRAAEVSELLVH